jgi:hypothetical protein
LNTLLDENGYTQEVRGMYYMIRDVDGDGELNDVVALPERKIGDYLIEVVPEPDALPEETYSLEVTANGETIVLAENVPISDIPSQPYTFTSDLDGDNDIDRDDLNILLKDRNKSVSDSSCGTACDLDGDGIITALDARKLVLLCTRPRCATE